ncbi:MAG: hypothetical protein NZ521_10440 [Flammeovirgaceae bacterium]|nr:hypothetical protein [Flammeovirgaceae bacterium]MDW8288639.1 hypothetical protein [Flammeovirgaceae bacterium]
MIRILSIVLAAIISFQVFQKTWIVLSYHIHQDFIAANLCQNKLNPASACKGKCYLKKQLQASSESQETPPTTFSTKVKIEWSLPFEITYFVFPTYFCVTNPAYFLKDESFVSNFLMAIFHPPCPLAFSF